jgi:hypothetical protein
MELKFCAGLLKEAVKSLPECGRIPHAGSEQRASSHLDTAGVRNSSTLQQETTSGCLSATRRCERQRQVDEDLHSDGRQR